MKRPAALLGPAGAAVIAVLALAGWLTGNLGLAGGGGAYVPTAPVTAITMLLLASATLIAGAVTSPTSRRIAMTPAAVVAMIAAAALVEGVGGPGAGISSLLAPVHSGVASSRVGVMSPVTAALLALLAVSLLGALAARRRWVLDLAAVLAGIALAGGATLTLTYLAGTPPFYAAAIVPVALPTALGVVGLGAGVLACRPGTARALGGLGPAAVAIAVGMTTAVVLYSAVARADDPAAPRQWPARAALASVTLVTAVYATFLAGRARREVEREAMLRRLAESETRYRALFEAAGDAIFLIEDGRFVDCNEKAKSIFGCAREEILGRTPVDYSPATQRNGALSAPAAEARLDAAMAGEPQQFEWLHTRADGSLFDAEVTLKRVDMPGRSVVQTILRDVTEQRRLRRVQTAINEISELASTAPTLDKLYAAIHAVIGRLMEARNLYIALYDRANDLLSFPYFVDEVDSAPAPFPPGRGLTGYVMRTCRPLLATPEMLAGLEASGEIEPLGAPSVDWLGVPLTLEGESIGVLAVQSYSRKVHYGEAEMEILSYVSKQVAQAISHKRAELAMRRLAIAVEHAAEMIVITGTDGTIEYVNPAFERITGYTREEALGRNPSMLKSGRQDDAFYRVLWQTVGEGGAWSGRLINRRKDGTLYEEEMSIAPARDDQGRIVNFIAVKRDVTREATLQRQLHESQRMEAVGRLAGGVAHDFNNLLQAMLSHVQLLGTSSLDGERMAEVRVELEDQIRRGAALTRQLLLFSRRESLRIEPLDVNEVITHASKLLRRLVRESIAFAMALDDAPLTVEADRGQLEQVLMNLVVNASDAMPRGGTLTLRTGGEETSVWLEVADTGAGISEENLPRIFEPFFTTKSREKGTGLGLAVVHGIVSSLGGSVGVRSRVGAGTQVRVVLHRSDDAAAPVPPPAPVADLPPGNAERLLVVEDEASARDGLQRALTMLGYVVVAVGSAEEALALPPEPKFALLLTDLVLPGVQGSELMRQLKQRWPALEAIVMSGYTDDEEMRERIGRGAVCFLQKPFDIATLAQEVRRLLDRRGGDADAASS